MLSLVSEMFWVRAATLYEPYETGPITLVISAPEIPINNNGRKTTLIKVHGTQSTL